MIQSKHEILSSSAFALCSDAVLTVFSIDTTNSIVYRRRTPDEACNRALRIYPCDAVLGVLPHV